MSYATDVNKLSWKVEILCRLLIDFGMDEETTIPDNLYINKHNGTMNKKRKKIGKRLNKES